LTAILATTQKESRDYGKFDIMTYIESMYLSEEREIALITKNELCNLFCDCKIYSVVDQDKLCSHSPVDLLYENRNVREKACRAAQIFELYYMHKLPPSRTVSKKETFNLLHTKDELRYFYNVLKVHRNGGRSKRIVFLDVQGDSGVKMLRYYNIKMRLIRQYKISEIVQIETNTKRALLVNIIFHQTEMSIQFLDPNERDEFIDYFKDQKIMRMV
jgi:hypothetical protein